MPRVLLIDHEDSFTYNLVQALGSLGAEVEVVRDRDLRSDTALPDTTGTILLGPGPGGPADRPASLALLERVAAMERSAAPRVLGVCLGLQLVVHWRGGLVGRGRAPVHGFAEAIEHDGRGVFTDLPNPVTMARYHSLVAKEPLPHDLEVSARSAEGEIMALRSRTRPIECVQFHPESILAEHGQALLARSLAPQKPAPSGSVHSGQGPDDARRGSGSDSAGNARTTTR